MKAWFERYTTEIVRFGTGLAGFAALAGLVVTYATPLQASITEHPGIAAAIGLIVICAMTAAAYIDLPRYVFLIAVPFVFVCAAVWVLLTVKTLGHMEFYSANIARSASHISEPEQLSGLSPADRREFARAPRRLGRAALKIQHHLDRHAFWSRALLAMVACTIAIGFLPRIFPKRPGPDV